MTDKNNPFSVRHIHGIPCFSEDKYWGKTPKEELEQALDVLEGEGWEAFYSQFKNRFDFTFEENRADWRFVVPTQKNISVLDLGAGMGRISIPLARVVDKVTAVDTSLLRMRFLKKRSEKEGLENIDVYVGDVFDLPFVPDSFDLIVMNGVLEWVGKTERFKDPKEAQLEALRICHRLLRKGGFLYVGIENRFALSYLKALDHSGLRFTSFMPRVLANWYVQLRIGSRYNTYTYTHKGYTNLFLKTGFSSVYTYLPYPGYNLPRIMIPFRNLQALRYAIYNLMSARSLKQKIVRILLLVPGMPRLYRFFFFSFGFVVKK